MKDNTQFFCVKNLILAHRKCMNKLMYENIVFL